MLIPMIAVLIINYFAYLCNWLSISFQEIWMVAKRDRTSRDATCGNVLDYLVYGVSFRHADMVVDS
ncbi:hypothetical protein [uncultured Bacteroides sp.]|uniref:hypothetical protein n=1 Tax=uncultured Bacteroides sp. TaxID=162156 RepID=UPI0026E51949|nr:hypothetical protein [uncultured Bacteroides sp.]